MKKFGIGLHAFAAVLLLLAAGAAMANATSTASKDMNQLKAEIMILNNDAQLPHADGVIAKQLADRYGIGLDKIDMVVSRNMQYGEAAAVLAFANKMPGGINDANINRIISLKNTGGWKRVAEDLKVNVGDVADQVGDIEDGAHRDIRVALIESPAPGTGAGGTGPKKGSNGSGY